MRCQGYFLNFLWGEGGEGFSTTCHFEKEKKNIFLTSYTAKTKSKGKKICCVIPLQTIAWQNN